MIIIIIIITKLDFFETASHAIRLAAAHCVAEGDPELLFFLSPCLRVGVTGVHPHI